MTASFSQPRASSAVKSYKQAQITVKKDKLDAQLYAES